MKSWTTFTWFTIAAAVPAGCSWKANTDLALHLKMPSTASRPVLPRHTVIHSRATANNPTTIEGMHCYLVSVAGNGISPGISDEQLGSRKNSCFGFGAISEAMGLYDLTRTGKTFRVSSGANRTVRVYGIFSSTLGRSCEGKTLAEIFATATRPRVYQLGETVGDLYRDSKIVVNNSYDATSADDLAEICPSSTNSGDTGDPAGTAPLSGSRLIAFNVYGANYDNVVNYDIDAAGTATVVQSYNSYLSPAGIDVSADSANVILSGTPSSSNGNVLHLPLDVTGANAGKWTRTLSGSLGSSTNHFEIGFGTPPYFYLRGVDKIAQARIHANLPPAPLGETNNPSLLTMAAFPDFLFTMSTNGGVQPNVQRISSTDGSLAIGVTPISGPLSGAQTTPPLYVPSKKWFIFTVGERLYLATLNTTSLILSTPYVLNFGTSNYLGKIRYDAATQTIFAMTQTSGGTAIYAVPIDATGSLPVIAPAGAAVDTSFCEDFAYTEDKKFFFFPIGGNPKIKVFRQSSGAFTEITSIPTNTNAARVAVIPLY